MKKILAIVIAFTFIFTLSAGIFAEEATPSPETPVATPVPTATPAPETPAATPTPTATPVPETPAVTPTPTATPVPTPQVVVPPIVQTPVVVANPAQPTTKTEIKKLIVELKGLCGQRNALAHIVSVKQHTIERLLSIAKKAGEKDKVEAAKSYKTQIKSINTEIQKLRESKKETWLIIKASKAEKNLDGVKAGLIQVINYKKQIIIKVNEKLNVLDQIIDTLK